MSYPVVAPSFQNNTAFDNADRGFVASLDSCIIKGKDGQVVWNNEEYAFLKSECPPTVNPLLWRQGQLTSKQGLFQVTDGIYQVRGFDISNMTLIEGESGVIILDTLASVECSAAALEFYRSHRGNRPVMAVMYSHSHYDHFGGAQGVLPVSSGTENVVPVIAPEGFMEEVLKENVVAGPAMRRRAVFMFGGSLPKGPRAHVGCGLGMAASGGAPSLVPPTDSIYKTDEKRTIDGIEMIFQMVPETEAPCEMNVFFPKYRALYIAECATNTMHNIATLRGAQVRDAKKWSKQLDETLVLYGYDSDVVFSGHHWPTWGHDNIVKFVSDQRDLYAYIHDQTVRLMNKGLTATEIAEQLRLPPGLQQEWYTREYYGCLSQNVKGIYQRYMTWFDGNPANIWKHPPHAEGERYVECMGGAAAVIKKAQEFADRQDLRFAATLLDHVVAAEPDNEQGRENLAQIYERLGFGAENAVWRNFYLTGAQQLRSRRQGGEQSVISMNPLSTVEQWFDALSLQLDGLQAFALPSEQIIVIEIPEQQTAWTLRLRNGTLTYRSQILGNTMKANELSEKADITMTLTRDEVYKLLAKGQLDAAKRNARGNLGVLTKLLELCSIIIT